MSKRMTITVDDDLGERIEERAGASVSGWFAAAAREKLDRETAAAYEEWDASLSDQERTELSEWDALPYPEDAAA